MGSAGVRVWWWAVVATVVGIGVVRGAVHHVPDDYQTIQAGIDAAAAGDTVLVASGTYYEHDIFIDSGICLRSETGEAGCVVIDGEGQSTVIGCIYVPGRICIEGFTIRGGNRSQGGGVYAFEADLAITNCAFVDNSAEYGGGIYYDWAVGTITNCLFYNNTSPLGASIMCYYNSSPTINECVFDNNSHGMLCLTGSSPLIRNCTFHGNAGGYGGIAALWYSNPTLQNTIIAHSTEGPAVVCEEDNSTATLTCCDLFGNAGGDWVGCIAAQYGIYGNFSANPLFCDPDSVDFTLHSDSPCAWANNPECGYIGALPVGCGETASVMSDQDGPDRSPRVFPNPSTGRITIDFPFPTSGWISAQILDVSGRVVRDLFNGTYPHVYAGEFSLTWDGRDDAGQRVASGVYVASVDGTGGRRTSRVVVAR